MNYQNFKEITENCFDVLKWLQSKKKMICKLEKPDWIYCYEDFHRIFAWAIFSVVNRENLKICIEYAESILQSKNKEYTSGDPFENFRIGAELSGQSMQNVLLDYMLKHVVYLKMNLNNNFYKEKKEHLADVLNYCIILYGMEKEYGKEHKYFSRNSK